MERCNAWVSDGGDGVRRGVSAQAADLPILRGGFTDGYSSGRAGWQGFYVGGQGSWGGAKSNLPGGINTDMQNTFLPPGGIGYELAAIGNGAHPQRGLRRALPATIPNGKMS